MSRAVHIDGHAIPYKIGKSNVVIQINSKRKHVASFKDVMQMDWPTIERAQDKGYFHITPADIKEYILREGLDAAIY